MRKLTIGWLFLVTALAAAQQGSFPVFENDKISPSEFRDRREKLKSQIGPGGMGVFFTNPTRNRNNDVDFLFRGDSTFLYLTGFEEPDAALVLIPDGADVNGRRVTEVLFVNTSTAMSETWLGYRMGPSNAMSMLGLELALPNTEFEKTLPFLAAGAPAKKLTTGIIPTDPSDQLGRMAAAFSAWREAAGFSAGPRGQQLVNRMREIKSKAEIALLKKVAEISARAHVEVLRSVEPGMREWEVGALVQYVFFKEGCEYTGYPPICGSGPNSTILHYQANRRLMQAGDVMCMDTAGEYHGYSADVTRSFPISGKFSKEQRAIYDAVYKAQEAGIRACKAGASVSAIGSLVWDTLAQAAIEIGLISKKEDLRRYYMHGFGHGIGLDVHDPLPGTLQPGAVLTVEPGLYVKAGSPCDPKWWNIGIRIEDDILVTEEGPVNLSAGCPRKADEIEKLMKETGLGNVKMKPFKG
jgi:Xaa-Pro aminopeptidase